MSPPYYGHALLLAHQLEFLATELRSFGAYAYLLPAVGTRSSFRVRGGVLGEAFFEADRLAPVPNLSPLTGFWR